MSKPTRELHAATLSTATTVAFAISIATQIGGWKGLLVLLVLYVLAYLGWRKEFEGIE